MTRKIVVGVVALLLVGGVVGGYLEYREVKRSVEPLRERWEAARANVERMEAALLSADSARRAALDSLERERTEAERDTTSAAEDAREAEAVAVEADADTDSALAVLARKVRPQLRPVVEQAREAEAREDSAQTAVVTALRRQQRATAALARSWKEEAALWKGRADTLEAINAELHVALEAAEEEREVWKSKARYDLLTDGPKDLLKMGGAALVTYLVAR